MMIEEERAPSETTSQLRALRAEHAADEALRDNAVAEAIASCRAVSQRRRRLVGVKGAKRVLVADDEEALLRAYRRWLLEVADFVDIASSVSEALVCLERYEYDLLVLDYQLLNGTAVDIIRRARETSLVPVILISGRIIDRDLPSLAAAAGATAFLAKPFDGDALQDAVNGAFARQARVLR